MRSPVDGRSRTSSNASSSSSRHSERLERLDPHCDMDGHEWDDRREYEGTDRVRLEAWRISIRAKEVDLKRKKLLAERERLKIVDLSAKLSLENASRQVEEVTHSLAVQMIEGFESDEHKGHLPR